MIDLDALFDEARRRINKAIDRRALIELGKPTAFANRSVGQRYKRKKGKQ